MKNIVFRFTITDSVLRAKSGISVNFKICNCITQGSQKSAILKWNFN